MTTPEDVAASTKWEATGTVTRNAIAYGNPDTAVALFIVAHGALPHSVDADDGQSFEVAGKCEACGKVLYVDFHRYTYDSEDGCLLCETPCAADIARTEVSDPDAASLPTEE